MLVPTNNNYENDNDGVNTLSLISSFTFLSFDTGSIPQGKYQ